MSNLFKTHSYLIKEEDGKYFFKFGKYGWIIQTRDICSTIPEYLGGDKAIYEMFPIEWINDVEWKPAIGKFQSFPAVLSYLTEVKAARFMILLKDDITEHYSR